MVPGGLDIDNEIGAEGLIRRSDKDLLADETGITPGHGQQTIVTLNVQLGRQRIGDRQGLAIMRYLLQGRVPTQEADE